MLNVTEAQKGAFLSDSAHKELTIKFDGYSYDELNYFVGEVSNNSVVGASTSSSWGTSFTRAIETPLFAKPENAEVYDTDLSKSINFSKFDSFKYLNVSIKVKNTNIVFTKGSADVSIRQALCTFRGINSQGTTYSIAMRNEEVEAGVYKSTNSYAMRNATPSQAITSMNIGFIFDFSNVVYDNGSLEYQIYIDASELMINLSDEYGVYKPYEKSAIVNGVFPPIVTTPPINNDQLIKESFTLTESICSQDNIKYGLCEASKCEFTFVQSDKENLVGYTIKPSIEANETGAIPLGKFTIDSVNRSIKHGLIQTTATAYDEMAKWDTDATTWYKRYMYGIQVDADTQATPDPRFNPIGVDFARQMYSTYFNIAKKYGYEDLEKYPLTFVSSYTPYGTTAKDGYTVAFGVPFEFNGQMLYDTFVPHECVIPNPDPTKLYCAKVNLSAYQDPETREIHYNPTESQWWDWLCVKQNKRGLMSSASIMVCETLSDGSYNKFLVNADDLFALSPNCVTASIFIGFEVSYYNLNYKTFALTATPVANMMLYTTPMPDWVASLVNRSTRLVYYNWQKVDFSNEDNYSVNCELRGVMRSLFEINGAFVRFNRYGKLELLYPSKKDLYPREDLFPSENIFPSRNVQRMPRSRYLSCEFESYQTQDYGKIQIKSSNTDADCETVKTYVGDQSKSNVYVMDTNIFYSNSFVKFDLYSYDGMDTQPFDVVPEVMKMLENMFLRIRNQGFTPNETKAIGMPWIEVGDRVTLITPQDGFSSFVFRRTLKGIQLLIDTYEAKGDEVIQEIK